MPPRRVTKGEGAATLIEYAFLVALLALPTIGAIGFLATQVSETESERSDITYGVDDTVPGATATTAATTTTTPCSVTLSFTPNPVARGGGSNLASDVSATFSTTGGCTSFTATVIPTVGPTVACQGVSLGGCTVKKSSGDWSDAGSGTVTVYQSGSPVGSGSFTVS